jgi:GTP cyclohydrolase I
MQAFDNPVFVEDVVRNVAQELQANTRVAWFRVRAVNDESIHNHSAFAQLEGAVRFADRPELPTPAMDSAPA